MDIRAASILFYEITIAVTFVTAVITFTRKPGRMSRDLSIASVLVFLLAVGRLLYVSAEGLQGILIGRRLINFPGCWLWFFIFLFIMEYTRTKLKQPLLIAMMVLNYFNSAVVLFTHVRGLFYTDYRYRVLANGLPELQTAGYGFAAYIYFASEALYICLAVGLIANYLVRYSRVRASITIILALSIVIPTGVYIYEVAAKIPVSVLPLAAAAEIILMNVLMSQAGVYDMDAIVRDIAVDAQDSPVFMVADGQYFLGANQKAFDLFPVLEKAVPWMSLSEVSAELDDLYSGRKKTISLDGRDYEPNIWYVDDPKQKLDALWLFDVTDRNRHQEFLASYRADLEKEVSLKAESLSQTENRLSDILTQTVTSLMSMVDSKDRYTSGHSFRVAQYARQIAALTGRSKAEQDLVYVTSLLHDVGKIHVSNEIINKKGKLTKEEFEIIKLHPMTGYSMLTAITNIPGILQGARWHHERYDGKGYPDGLSGENIPWIARLIAVADSYDAMTSRRSYRDILPQDVVRGEIERNIGTQFDPEYARAMLRLMDEDRDYRMRQQPTDVIGQVFILNERPEDGIADKLEESRLFTMTSVTTAAALLPAASDPEKISAVIIDADGADRETIAALRKKYPSMSVIALTGDCTVENFSALIGEGADNVLMRPFGRYELMEAVNVVLQKAASVDAWKKGNVSPWSLGWM